MAEGKDFLSRCRNYKIDVNIGKTSNQQNLKYMPECQASQIQVQRTWQDAWSFSAHARCRQLSSQILAKLFSFINIFGVDSRLGDDPQLFCVLRDL